MPRTPGVPSVVLHKASGQAVVFLRQPDGKRAMVYLGKHGSAEAERRYREVLAQHFAGQSVETVARKVTMPSEWPTVGQLCAAFLLHAQRFYVGEDGKPTRTVINTKIALDALLQMYRDTPIDQFKIRDLGLVRQRMIDTEYGHRRDKETGRPVPGSGRKRCRNYINGSVSRIKQVVRWGVEQGLVPGATWHELSALKGLPIGRAGVPESKPVGAVPKAAVDAVLPHLPPTLRAAVVLQWWTGMRPAECLSIRLCDIDRSGDDWVYRPPQHKGKWRGVERAIVLGPQATEKLASRVCDRRGEGGPVRTPTRQLARPWRPISKVVHPNVGG